MKVKSGYQLSRSSGSWRHCYRQEASGHRTRLCTMPRSSTPPRMLCAPHRLPDKCNWKQHKRMTRAQHVLGDEEENEACMAYR